MESLLAKQKDIYAQIKKININFSKDSAVRKSKPKYIPKRLAALSALWNEFDKNHDKLEASETKVDPYFTADFYSSVHQYFSSTKLLISSYKIEKKEHKGEEESSSGSDESEEEEEEGAGTSRFHTPPNHNKQDHGVNSLTDDLFKKQASNFRAFTRTITSLDLDNINSTWELEDALRSLESRWKTVDQAHWELDKEMDGSINTIYEKAFTTHERTYNQIKKAINSKMWSVSHREKFTPRIDIPVFHGSYQAWVSFKDLFCEAIHNNPSMSDAQKMQFLKSKLRGKLSV